MLKGTSHKPDELIVHQAEHVPALGRPQEAGDPVAFQRRAIGPADGHRREGGHQRRHGRLQTGAPAGGAGHRRVRLRHRHNQLPQPGRLSQRTHRQGTGREHRLRPPRPGQPGQRAHRPRLPDDGDQPRRRHSGRQPDGLPRQPDEQRRHVLRRERRWPAAGLARAERGVRLRQGRERGHGHAQYRRRHRRLAVLAGRLPGIPEERPRRHGPPL